MSVLPENNLLSVIIRTREVTDASLPHLKELHRLDSLDVTETSISDAGIVELSKAFSKAVVPQRKSATAGDSTPHSPPNADRLR
jgi:hypothetical protein